MKVAEYIADYLAEHTTGRVYGICGGAAMHLNDAIANHPKLKVTAMHHEQAAAFAAEADARLSGRPSTVMVTAGPGGTNATTGVACAWADSIPMIVLAGQVPSHSINYSGLRQLGLNELPMVQLMKTITKYAVTVTDPEKIRFTLDRALHLATSGRQGPVFIEVPLDMQAAEIEPDRLQRCDPVMVDDSAYVRMKVNETVRMLEASQRPVVIVGNGVTLAWADGLFRQVFGNVEIPVVSSWSAADIMVAAHWNYIGRCGILGDRAANWTVQGADLILAIGTKLTAGQIGYVAAAFAPNAKKIIVDVDKEEVFRKPTVKPDLGVVADAGDFLREFSMRVMHDRSEWTDYCRTLREYNYVINEHPTQEAIKNSKGINAYAFIEQLGQQLGDDAIVVTDAGFSFTVTFQALKLKVGQRLIYSPGVSPMGWGLPAAIGAAMAAPGRQIVCLTGDGGIMLNLQELQTIAQHKLPIAIFVYENDGYLTMRNAQNNHFKREVMAGPESGVTLPDFMAIAQVLDISCGEWDEGPTFDLSEVFEISRDRPSLSVLHMDPHQVMAPRVQAKMLEGGKFSPTSLDDMWPHLERQVMLDTPDRNRDTTQSDTAPVRGQEPARAQYMTALEIARHPPIIRREADNVA